MQVDPETAYLKEEFGQRAFFPDSNHEFNLPTCVGVTIFSLMVEGSFLGSRSVALSSTPGSSGTRPVFSGKKELSVKVKVVQASTKKLSSGKVEFTRENQTYVTVTEATANVDYVTQAIQRKWGFNYVLVTADGLKFDDSAQGM